MKTDLHVPEFVSFDNKRRFLVSPRIGCLAECSYCYLHDLGLGDGVVRNASADELIQGIVGHNGFVDGPSGTIVSFGCFTECLIGSSLKTTIEVARFLLSRGNRVSIASKMRTGVLSCLLRRCIQYRGQLSVFVSCPTVSKWRDYEKRVASPEARMRAIPRLLESGFDCFLYVKPYLGIDTCNDSRIYLDIIEKLKIPVVVGKRFSSCGEGSASPVAPALLSDVEDISYAAFVASLEASGTVFRRSLDALV